MLNTEDEPNDLGFTGSWQEIAAGRAIIGVDSNDETINAAGKTVGSVNPLTSHTHGDNSGGILEGSRNSWATSGDRLNMNISGQGGHPNTAMQSAGSNTNHNNWQPSFSLHIWERIN